MFVHNGTGKLGLVGYWDVVAFDEFAGNPRPTRINTDVVRAGGGAQAAGAFQFDWSEDWAVIAGERTKLQVAHFTLSHSRAFMVRVYPLQTHEMLFDAHNRAFAVLGGVPRRSIYDNMRTAVDKVRRGKERDVNARFSAMVSHYLFEAEFCNPASGWEKGQVEKSVRDARHRLWQPVPAFASSGELNDWLETRCIALWGEIAHGKLPGTVADVWVQEKPLLMPMPRPFDGFVEHTKLPGPLRAQRLQRAVFLCHATGPWRRNLRVLHTF